MSTASFPDAYWRGIHLRRLSHKASAARSCSDLLERVRADNSCCGHPRFKFSRAAGIFRGGLYARALTLNTDRPKKGIKYQRSKARSHSKRSGKFGSLETKTGIFDKICGKQKKAATRFNLSHRR
jgi:hypothetical protein